jgi:hypothetical protein
MFGNQGAVMLGPLIEDHSTCLLSKERRNDDDKGPTMESAES